MNYDPNLVTCGRMASQTVKLTFQIWEVKCEKTVKVGGNCRGLDVIRTAVGIVYDNLCDDQDPDCPELIFVSANGDQLIDADDDDKGPDWLEDRLVCAEIIAIEPDQDDKGKKEVAA